MFIHLRYIYVQSRKSVAVHKSCLELNTVWSQRLYFCFRDNYSRGRDYGRDYDRRRAYSPLRGGGRDISPPVKRSRYESEPSANTAGVSQPAMLTFKQFLANQDDCIDDQDAVKKYADYKTDFKRQQLEEFFKAHKDEEWWVPRIFSLLTPTDKNGHC